MSNTLSDGTEIESRFSREAVLKGSFDKYAEIGKGKKGTAEVDSAFLQEIESWRELVARNLALRNPALSQRELNFSVQRIIDRIIFLRICEDRDIEQYGKLLALTNGSHVYGRLCQLFQQANDRYNSGLFHFQKEKDRSEPPDNLTLLLEIDDKLLKDILASLYYPDSPYEFSVLPADILGQVYEQFLGKVIRLTAGHHAVIEDKPEVKKAGGVYYTPTYIVDYIVKNTVGKLLEENNPKQAVKLKILDPACGSGSFLIGAYQYLLDWHRDWYVNDGPEKSVGGRSPVLYQAQGGGWRLTTAERKRILLNNIYGVDIDPQAVEVTKLSLLLKVLEGENDQTLARQLRMFHERALPDLGSNIKCGNSLIGPDFYKDQQLSLLDREEQYRINAFNWETEFPAIMKAGGFDAVIGNPPYVRQESLGEEFKRYASCKYSTFAGTADLYVYFIEQSHHLLCSNGYFGMICSNKFMRSKYGEGLRAFLSTEASILMIVDFGELPVFHKAATFPLILITANRPTREQQFIYAPLKRLTFYSLAEEVGKIMIKLDSRSASGENWTLTETHKLAIFDKLKKGSVPLGEYVKSKIYRGILTGLNDAFVINQRTMERLIAEDGKCKEIIKPFVVGDDIRKYRVNFQKRYLIFARRGIDIKKYPAIERHLCAYRERLTPKPKGWSGTEWKGRKPGGYRWYEIQDTIDYFLELEKPKIVYPDIAKESRMAFDKSGIYLANTIYFIPTEDLYLLGILNSKLVFAWYKRVASVLGDADKGGRLRWFSQDVMKIPIRRINFTDPADKSRHDQMVHLVENMLELHKRLADAKTDHDKTSMQRQIDQTDREIDAIGL